MRNTDNLGLALYDANDKMSITAAENSLNHNMELLDAEVAKKMSAPESGTAGQVLTKTEGGYVWQDAPAGDGSGGINDEATEAGSTWSSLKIAQEVGTKLDQETFDRVFYISEPSVNLYDPTTEGWEDNAFIYGSGSVIVDESKSAKYCVTPPIPIEAGKTYTIAPAIAPDLEAKNRARTYTYTGVVLDVMDFTKNEDGSITFTTPVGSAFIRFVVGKEFLTGGTSIATTMPMFNSKFMLVEGTSAPESYIPYIPAQNTLRNIDIPDNSVKIEKIDASAAAVIAPLKGKTIANFGDSIFGNTRPPLDLSSKIAGRTGATVYNCAFGGCRMGPHIGHWDAFSMYRLATAIASGDYSVQDDALTYDDRPSYAEEPVAEIKAIDFSALDIMTIAYGVNDFTGNNPIDNAENPLDTTTLCGALRYSIETLLTAFPQLRIFILLPTYSYRKDDSGAFIEDMDTITNSLGKTLAEYSQALSDVAKAYKLPVIDNYNELGVNKLNREKYLADGAHHTQAGLELLAEHIAHALW